MNFYELLYLIVCGIGTLNSLLLSFYAFFNKKGNIVLNRVFSILILTFALRISKSLWVEFFNQSHPILHSLWFPAFISVGPLIYIYFSMLSGNLFTKYYKNLLFITCSIIISLIVISLAGDGTNHQLLILSVFLSIILGIYFSLSPIKFILQKTKVNKSIIKNWCWIIMGFITLDAFLYISIYFVKIDVLLIESYLFSISIYIFMFFEIKNNILSIVHKIQVGVNAEDKEIIDSLTRLMKNDKIFLDPDLSLSNLASKINSNSHEISRVLNSSLGLNYNDFVNQYRIYHAKNLLLNNSDNKKISAIAFESGFNSISVFNSSFKKFTGITPSRFINQ